MRRFLPLALLFTLAAPGATLAEEGHEDLPHHVLELFVGRGTEDFADRKNEHGPAIGLDYAYRFHPRWAVGAVIAVAACAALVAFQKWEEWVNAALGAWLIVSPFILGFGTQTAIAWNQIVVGALVGALAVSAAMNPPSERVST